MEVTDSNNGDMDVNLNNVDITDASTALAVDGTGGTGAFALDLNGGSITDPLVTGMNFNDVDNGTVTVNNNPIGAGGNATTAGINVVDSDATFNFGAGTDVSNVAGTAFRVSGTGGNISMQGDITNTAGLAVEVTGVTGGLVTTTGTLNHNDGITGINVHDNTGGTISILGTNNVTTSGATPAVAVTDNTGADVSLADMTINATGTGPGFFADGGGDLTLTGTNVVTTDQGVAVSIDGLNVVGTANFDRVTVNNGATNGIFLNNVTGGAVTIGSTTGAASTLNTTGEAIDITNAANVTINNTDIAASGGTASVDLTNSDANAMRVALNDVNVTEAGIPSLNVSAMDGLFRLDVADSDLDSNVVIDASSADPFGLSWNNTSINTAQDIAMDLNFQSTVGNVDIIIGGAATVIETTSNAAGAMALDFDVTGTGPDIDFSLDDATLRNANRAGVTAEFLISGGSIFDANIRDNTFINNGAGNQFQMTSNGATTLTSLFLRNNTAVNYELITDQVVNPPFNFQVQDTDAVNFNDTKNGNTGTVTFTPAEANFLAIPGPIAEPILP